MTPLGDSNEKPGDSDKHRPRRSSKYSLVTHFILQMTRHGRQRTLFLRHEPVVLLPYHAGAYATWHVLVQEKLVCAYHR